MSAGGANSALRFAGRTSSDPARVVSRWKALSGGKAVGCLPFFIPEEILHAAGNLPVTICGDEYVTAGGRWEVLDGFVFPPIAGLLPDTMSILAGTVHGLPQVSLEFSSRAMAVPSLEEALDRVELLREWAGELSGRHATDGALEKSIGVFNENRRLFSVLEERVASEPGAYSAGELCGLFRSALALPAEAHTELLQAALSRQPAPRRASGARIFLAGGMATPAPMDAIDAAGAVVVGLAFLAGNRVPESMAEERGDPALALARRLRSQMLAWAEQGPSRAVRQLERVEASGADRFLYLGGVAGFPDRYGELGEEADKRGIPFLRVEGDLFGGHPEDASARLARFLAPGKSH